MAYKNISDYSKMKVEKPSKGKGVSKIGITCTYCGSLKNLTLSEFTIHQGDCMSKYVRVARKVTWGICRWRESYIRARGQTNPIHPGLIRTDFVE